MSKVRSLGAPLISSRRTLLASMETMSERLSAIRRFPEGVQHEVAAAHLREFDLQRDRTAAGDRPEVLLVHDLEDEHPATEHVGRARLPARLPHGGRGLLLQDLGNRLRLDACPGELVEEKALDQVAHRDELPLWLWTSEQSTQDRRSSGFPTPKTMPRSRSASESTACRWAHGRPLPIVGAPGSHSGDNTFHMSLNRLEARCSTFQHSGNRHEMFPDPSRRWP